MTPASLSNHIIFEKLDQLKEALNTENAKIKIGIDNFTFFDTGYRYIKDRLRLTLPVLIQETELNAIASEIEACTTQINAFLGNDNIGHINNAINNLNSSFNRAKNLPFPLSKDDFDFSKSIIQFQHIVKEAYESLQSKNTELQSEMKLVNNELADKQLAIVALEKQLAEKQTEIQNVLIGYNSDFESLKNSANSSIESERKKQNDLVEADRKAAKELIDTDKELFKKEFELQKNELDKLSADLIYRLEYKLSEAKAIVSIVGNVGVTGNYQKIANQHNSSANFFRWVALGFMVVMSGLLIYSIIELGNSDFNLYKSLVRILAAAVLTYPAVYASRESSRHRNLETKNRNLELELASIGPFIELLPEPKKVLIKEELVKKYFGNDHPFQADKEEDKMEVSVNGLEKILKTILPYIKK